MATPEQPSKPPAPLDLDEDAALKEFDKAAKHLQKRKQEGGGPLDILEALPLAVKGPPGLAEIVRDPAAVLRVPVEALPEELAKLGAAMGALKTRLPEAASVPENSQLPEDPNRPLTEDEVCELLRISKETLLKAKRDPLDPIPYKKVGRRYLYDRTEVMRWATRQGERDWKQRTKGRRRSGRR
jgi:excisionase family DNA binding protein